MPAANTMYSSLPSKANVLYFIMTCHPPPPPPQQQQRRRQMRFLLPPGHCNTRLLKQQQQQQQQQFVHQRPPAKGVDAQRLSHSESCYNTRSRSRSSRHDNTMRTRSMVALPQHRRRRRPQQPPSTAINKKRPTPRSR